MIKSFSINEAENKLSLIIQMLEENTPVKLTKYGKPVAVLLSFDEYQRLTHKKGDFWTALTEFRQTMKKENIEISDTDFEGLRYISAGREVDLS